MFDLNGKGALVTGASGGIGGAVAKLLHRQGASVAISGTKREKLELLAGELGERVHVLPCDLADRAQVAKLAGEAEAALGHLDILVNNAGVTKDNLFMMLKDEDWDRILAVNLTSAFTLCRGAIRGMIKRRWGRIINISSISGIIGNPGQANYAASKAGMHGFTISLARENAKLGITVNTVSPGYVATDMVMAVPEEVRAKIAAEIPTGRLGTPDEIAYAVAFLVAEEAAWITGSNLDINGGHHMGW
jgi:3-oxoacyl-[acyl-carrier protein] reductase